jgi:shikimate dehydrogenase
MKKAYVIGDSVKNSLSPTIFNYWFKKYNINAKYYYKQTSLEKFKSEVSLILKDKNVCGINITIPFKEKINSLIDGIDKDAHQIGATNYLSKSNNKWIGGNTDWIGFAQSINLVLNKHQKNKAVILGYGGAAKAVLYALKKEGFKDIEVFNRTEKKINILKNIKHTLVLSPTLLKKHLLDADLIINTTPVNPLSAVPKINFYEKNHAFDIVYKPKKTDFLLNFKEKKRIYGISMLINQAIPCFERWFGFRPEADSPLFSSLEDESTQ